MQRGTATILLVIGGVLLLAALFLYGGNVTSDGHNCGSVMSPETSFESDYPSGSAEELLDSAGAKIGCSDALGSRQWSAIVAGFCGVCAVLLGGNGLNTGPTTPAATAEPTPF